MSEEVAGAGGLKPPGDRHVLLFWAPGCRYSESARNDLDRRGVRYEAFNVADDADALARMTELSGGRRVPVIVRGDRVTVGFGGTTVV